MKLTQEQLKSIIDDPKSFLNRGYRTNERLAAKRERVESWRRRAESITVELRRTPGGSGPSKIVENSVCNIADLQAEIEAEIRELIAVQREIQVAIDELAPDSNLKAVLELRYLNCYPWEEIAVKLNYSFRWALTLHGRALAALQETARQKKAC